MRTRTASLRHARTTMTQYSEFQAHERENLATRAAHSPSCQVPESNAEISQAHLQRGKPASSDCKAITVESRIRSILRHMPRRASIGQFVAA